MSFSSPDSPNPAPQVLGAFAFVLHSHIPYVLSHGQWPHGTDWLTEVAAESYLPLLAALHELIDEGLSPKITLGLTPILCEQLSDDGFKNEFEDWLHTQIGAASQDVRTFRANGNGALLALAGRWREWFQHTLRQFEFYDRDIVQAFRTLQDAGHIEIITSAATHGYLPSFGNRCRGGRTGQTGHTILPKTFRAQTDRLLAAGMRVPAPLQMERAAGRFPNAGTRFAPGSGRIFIGCGNQIHLCGRAFGGRKPGAGRVRRPFRGT